VEYTLKDRQDVSRFSYVYSIIGTHSLSFIGDRQSTSSILSVFQSGNPLSTRSLARSLDTPTRLFTQHLRAQRFIIYFPSTSLGPSSPVCGYVSPVSS
jgi:hypothetical protein